YAACIKISCGGQDYCIGTDKIGHFFQQGHMLYELKQAIAKSKPGWGQDDINRIVEAWSASTEGFLLHPHIADLLRNIKVEFYGMPGNALDFVGKWGGFKLPAG